MSSREQILNKLRAARKPFGDVPPITERRPMIPMADESELRTWFVQEAAKVSVKVHEAADNEAAIAVILSLIGEDKSISGWDFSRIPLPGLAEALAAAGITRADPYDGSVRVGLTGVAAAIAATGSLVVSSGDGMPRLASLLPSSHIAVVRDAQIVANLEAWYAAQKALGLDEFRTHANTVIITGSSRTADIGQELVLGAHGPIEVHVVLIE